MENKNQGMIQMSESDSENDKPVILNKPDTEYSIEDLKGCGVQIIDEDSNKNIQNETEELDKKLGEILREEEGEIANRGDEEKEQEKNVIDNKEIPQVVSHKKEKSGIIRLPLAKIKNIMKLDTEIKQCQKNAYYVIGRMTELFLQELAKKSHSFTKINKRKTVNLEDIVSAVKNSDKFGFIDLNSILTIEAVEDLKEKEERMVNKIQTKGEMLNKRNPPGGNMKIDDMFNRK